MYKHDKTGAQLMSVVNSDENKTFGVTFRCGGASPSHNTSASVLVQLHWQAGWWQGGPDSTWRWCLQLSCIAGCLGHCVVLQHCVNLGSGKRYRLTAATPTSAAHYRTPVANSRGVPHILEHSVLCGSRKYPIKVRLYYLLIGWLTVEQRLR